MSDPRAKVIMRRAAPHWQLPLLQQEMKEEDQRGSSFRKTLTSRHTDRAECGVFVQ